MFLGLFDFRPDQALESLCLAPIDPVQKVWLSVFTPFFAFVILILLAVLHAASQRACDRSRNCFTCPPSLLCSWCRCRFVSEHYIKSMILLVLSSYTAIASAVFRYFQCTSIPANTTTDNEPRSVLLRSSPLTVTHVTTHKSVPCSSSCWSPSSSHCPLVCYCFCVACNPERRVGRVRQ